MTEGASNIEEEIWVAMMKGPRQPPTRPSQTALAKRIFRAWEWLLVGFNHQGALLLQSASIVAAGFLVWVVIARLARSTVIVEPFGVPKSFEDAGYTPATVGNRIADQLREIAKEVRKEKLFVASTSESALPDIEVPETRVSLRTLVEFLQTSLGRGPTYVSGEISVEIPRDGASNALGSDENTQQITVSLRMTSGQRLPESFVLFASKLDDVPRQVSKRVLADVEPFLLAVDTYNTEHRENDALLLIRRCIAENLDTDSAYNFWGLILWDEGDLNGAIAKYQKAIELEPEFAGAYNNLGNALSDKGDRAGAIANYQKAIELDPEYAGAYINWGIALSEANDRDDAIAKYQKAIHANPKSGRAYYLWGNALFDKGDLDGAIDNYEVAAALEAPEPAKLYCNWGKALSDKGDLQGAAAKFQKATDFNSNYAEAYSEWALVLDRQGKADDAAAKRAKAAALSAKTEPHTGP